MPTLVAGAHAGTLLVSSPLALSLRVFLLRSSFSRLSLVATALLMSATAARAMDCAKAETLVETTICADPQIKWQDDAISRNYFAALTALREKGNKPAHDKMQGEQRRWLAERNACGLKAAGGLTYCVEEMTSKRLGRLPASAAEAGEVPPAGLRLGTETLAWGKTKDGLRTLTHRGRVVLKEPPDPRLDSPFKIHDRYKDGQTDAVLVEEGAADYNVCSTFYVVESRQPGAVSRLELGKICGWFSNEDYSDNDPAPWLTRNADGFAFVSPARPFSNGEVRQWRSKTGDLTTSVIQFLPTPGSTMNSLAASKEPKVIEPLRNAEFFAAVLRLKVIHKESVADALWGLTNGGYGMRSFDMPQPELYGLAMDPTTVAYSGCGAVWHGGAHFSCEGSDTLAVWDRAGGGFYFAINDLGDNGHNREKAQVEPPLASWPLPARTRYESWRNVGRWTGAPTEPR
ncbi:lysozyme inhibitor LprI family protein [Methylosinus sporium]|uniref:Lysozyme inhibitor LprI-like N-terminal domain-containing protein n=1 Tax=Methylosinus sporium TaxID=428 RepID=A0A2U1STA7_METSR|nr:lysozyme inhibitor LprI family protein [Methylosinus sporium]PWB94847.1 hypothetical protein C5689_05200 [Methylosinus sporium]